MEITTDGQIRSALRRLWLYSKERNACIKAHDRTCERCSARHSAAIGREVKIQVHHKEGIDWDIIIKAIREQLLVAEEKLECLCKDCHKKETYGSNT